VSSLTVTIGGKSEVFFGGLWADSPAYIK